MAKTRSMRVLRGIALLAGAAAACAGQATVLQREAMTKIGATRVEAINARFDPLLAETHRDKELREACNEGCTPEKLKQVQDEQRLLWTERARAVDSVAAEIQTEVERYIVGAYDTQDKEESRAELQEGLRRVLAATHGMPPEVFGTQAAGGAFVVAYLLQKGDQTGPRATAFTLRAYRSGGGTPAPLDTTGEDMNGYAELAVKELPSPAPGETWFLVWGKMTGANGPNVRMRIYAFAASRFRTVWMPENAWGAFTVELTADGFTVDGPYYRSKARRHDTYRLAPEGVYLAPPAE